MLRFAFVALILALSACSAPAPAEPSVICRPAGQEPATLTFGETDFSGRLVAVDVVQAESRPIQLSLKLDADGAADFARLTGDHIGETMPISLNGEVLSSPVIREKITGGDIAITGSFTLQEATDLARQIAPPCS